MKYKKIIQTASYFLFCPFIPETCNIFNCVITGSCMCNGISNSVFLFPVEQENWSSFHFFYYFPDVHFLEIFKSFIKFLAFTVQKKYMRIISSKIPSINCTYE